MTTSRINTSAANGTSPVHATRYNEDKLRYALLPADGIAALVEVYTIGAKKYAPRNWEKGLNQEEIYDSLQRHLEAWKRGEDRDVETGLLHTAMVTWNAMALCVHQLRGLREDTRPPKLENKDD